MPTTESSADHMISVDEFSAKASAWLEANAEPLPASDGEADEWGRGEFNVSVFHALSFDEESALLDELRTWQQTKATEGYHAITWPEEFGGLGLSKAHQRAFKLLERHYVLPTSHETFSVTTGLIAPTINVFGTPEQKARWIPQFLTTESFCAQLFSEPQAGSDLAGLGCRAVRDGDEWIINGQKVWSSGAGFSTWGELIARTDIDAPKHKGMSAFIIPMDLEGMEIRPIKQMSGGSSFNEVFFNDVRVPDDMRLGDNGEGWKVALTTLGFERDHSDNVGGGTSSVGGSWRQLLETAEAMGLTNDPLVRQRLMDVYIHSKVEGFTSRRAADMARGGTPGPEGSLGKLLWTEGMTLMSDVVSMVLGPKLIADTGEWGTYGWGEHVLGAPGYRIAGGSDEVQRNIVGERVLGLPAEPRGDKNQPWREIAR